MELLSREDLREGLDAALFNGYIVSDILNHNVTSQTIKICQYCINLYGEDNFPDFFLALATWKEIKAIDNHFIYETFAPLVKYFLNNDTLFVLLGGRNDSNSTSKE